MSLALCVNKYPAFLPIPIPDLANDLTILWNDQSLLHSGKFLTLPTVLPKVAASRILLEAAQLVYYEFWGKDVKDLLQDVPGHGNLQYLPQVQVDSLGLKHLFCPQVLLVCGEYKVVYEDLKPYGNDLEHRWGGVVVIGQPGIGMCLSPTAVTFANNCYPNSNPAKSGFLYYVLFCLLNEKKTVAFQVGGRFVLFQDTGVQLHDATDMEGYIIPDGTWALTDSRTSSEVPCQAFLTASRARNACIIQANATLQDYELWESPWRNECSVIMHKMPLEVMSSDELIALGYVQHDYCHLFSSS